MKKRNIFFGLMLLVAGVAAACGGGGGSSSSSTTTTTTNQGGGSDTFSINLITSGQAPAAVLTSTAAAKSWTDATTGYPRVNATISGGALTLSFFSEASPNGSTWGTGGISTGSGTYYRMDITFVGVTQPNGAYAVADGAAVISAIYQSNDGTSEDASADTTNNGPWVGGFETNVAGQACAAVTGTVTVTSTAGAFPIIGTYDITFSKATLGDCQDGGITNFTGAFQVSNG